MSNYDSGEEWGLFRGPTNYVIILVHGRWRERTKAYFSRARRSSAVYDILDFHCPLGSRSSNPRSFRKCDTAFTKPDVSRQPCKYPLTSICLNESRFHELSAQNLADKYGLSWCEQIALDPSVLNPSRRFSRVSPTTCFFRRESRRWQISSLTNKYTRRAELKSCSSWEVVEKQSAYDCSAQHDI